MTPEQAQKLHDARLAADPEHDVISCWCCCTDCDFEQDEQGNVYAEPDAKTFTPEKVMEACDEWDTTTAGTVEHEIAAAKVVALVQSYFAAAPKRDA